MGSSLRLRRRDGVILACGNFALEVFFGVIAFGFALLASICIGGPLSTGTREYALIFYGGRYKALGDILYPTQAIVGGATGAA